MRKLLISSLGVVGMLVISAFAFASSQNDVPVTDSETAGTVEVLETTADIVPMEQATVKEQEPTPEPTEKPTEEPYQSKIYSMDWGAEDAYLLAKIAMAEAENQDTEGKALVILVVLNRVWDDRFPDTIREVIYQENQFSPVLNGRFDKVEPNEDCWKALEMVQVGHWDKSYGALYFESKSQSTWHEEHLEFLFKHGDHYFYTEQESEE
jgi:spore-cortex-lytic enzyme, putative